MHVGANYLVCKKLEERLLVRPSWEAEAGFVVERHMRGWRELLLRLHEKKKIQARGFWFRATNVVFGVKTERSLRREEQKKTAGPGGTGSWWGSGPEVGPGKDLGLAQPGASLADAAADWMRGPPLTHCWRLELCVPGRLKPPLYPGASSSPPLLLLPFSVCTPSSSSSSLLYTLPLLRSAP